MQIGVGMPFLVLQLEKQYSRCRPNCDNKNQSANQSTNQPINKYIN